MRLLPVTVSLMFLRSVVEPKLIVGHLNFTAKANGDGTGITNPEDTLDLPDGSFKKFVWKVKNEFYHVLAEQKECKNPCPPEEVVEQLFFDFVAAISASKNDLQDHQSIEDPKRKYLHNYITAMVYEVLGSVDIAFQLRVLNYLPMGGDVTEEVYGKLIPKVIRYATFMDTYFDPTTEPNVEG